MEEIDQFNIPTGGYNRHLGPTNGFMAKSDEMPIMIARVSELNNKHDMLARDVSYVDCSLIFYLLCTFLFFGLCYIFRRSMVTIEEDSYYQSAVTYDSVWSPEAEDEAIDFINKLKEQSKYAVECKFDAEGGWSSLHDDLLGDVSNVEEYSSPSTHGPSIHTINLLLNQQMLFCRSPNVSRANNVFVDRQQQSGPQNAP